MIDEKIKKILLDSCEEIQKEKVVWCKQHNAPLPEPIEVLNLIMKKDNALRILKGDKNVEYRAYTSHYAERLFDKSVGDFAEKHINDEWATEQMGMYGFLDELRPVKKIHFHNYSNSWFLDVEVLNNGYVIANKDGVETMNAFGDHELDALVADLEKKKENNRPVYFNFILGSVIETNLK